MAEEEGLLAAVRILLYELLRLLVAEQQPTPTIPGELIVNETAIANSTGEKDVLLPHDDHRYAT
jgi:hypothetical protein